MSCCERTFAGHAVGRFSLEPLRRLKSFRGYRIKVRKASFAGRSGRCLPVRKPRCHRERAHNTGCQLRPEVRRVWTNRSCKLAANVCSDNLRVTPTLQLGTLYLFWLV